MNKIAYKHTKYGLIAVIYGCQRTHSKYRNDPMPDYSLLELRDWIFSQPTFNKLYENWMLSGYEKMTKPSCDRLDDYQPYTLNNLQLITWAENKRKGELDRKNGINNKQNKAVIQMSLDGEFIAEYYSGRQAQRKTGISQSNIGKCCRGSYKSANGYYWIFSLGLPINNNLLREVE